jgi:transposase
LETKVDKLTKLVDELRVQVNQNSRNSSKPPSSDPPWVPRPKKPKSKRPKGGQPGQPGSFRAAYPPEQMDEVVDFFPSCCGICGEGFESGAPPLDPEPDCHQVVDLPPIKPHVTDHRLHARQCRKCRMWTRAELPKSVPVTTFRPNVHALAAMLTGVYHVTRRAVCQLLGDLLGIPISLGTVSNMEGRIEKALEPARAEAENEVRKAGTVHSDETGWKEIGERAYLWTNVTKDVAVYRIDRRRNADVVREMLGPDFQGYMVSDRFAVYLGTPEEQRQVCHSHIQRDYEKIAARSGQSKEIGQQGLRLEKRLFRYWQRFKKGLLDRAGLRQRMQRVKNDMRALLAVGAECNHKKTARTCRNLLALWPALFVFVEVEGLDPTNNAAERALRQGVIWRKISFGSQSDRGSRFVASILTAVETIRLQKRTYGSSSARQHGASWRVPSARHYCRLNKNSAWTLHRLFD